MKAKKEKSAKFNAKRKTNVNNIFNQKEAPLQELIDANRGLYIPVNQLSANEMKLLKTYLGDIKTEPSAAVHVASAFVVSARVASAFVASAFVADADSNESNKTKNVSKPCVNHNAPWFQPSYAKSGTNL